MHLKAPLEQRFNDVFNLNEYTAFGNKKARKEYLVRIPRHLTKKRVEDAKTRLMVLVVYQNLTAYIYLYVGRRS
jgi:hypothetical protein